MQNSREKDKSISDIRLDDIVLSTRTKNCCKREHIQTLGQLSELTSEQILDWHNAGRKTLREIKALLVAKGLRLAKKQQDVTTGNNIFAYPENSTDIPDIELNNIFLSARTRNCCQREGIKTITQLSGLTEKTILSWDNAGEKTLREIIAALKAQNLCLAKEKTATSKKNKRSIRGEAFLEGHQDEPIIINILEATPEIQQKLVSKPQEFLISTRARNVLSKQKIIYFAELCQFIYQDLVDFKNAGVRTATELANLVHKHGLQLGTKIPDWSRQVATQFEHLYASDLLDDARRRLNDLLDSNGPKPKSLEDELARVANVLEKGRNALLLIKLWGWNGEKPRTLDSVGTELGLTRERVRQIEAKAIKKWKRYKFDVPYLKAAVSTLQKKAPQRVVYAKKILQEEKVSANEFSVASVKLACELFAIRWSFSEIFLGKERILVAAHEEQSLRKILPTVRRKTSELGCLNIFSLISEIQWDENNVDVLRQCLEWIPEIQWLDDNKEWLYSKSVSRNRLFNLCSKVLGVCPKIRISELRRSVGKSRRLLMAPPQKVLATFVQMTGLGSVTNEFAIVNENKGFPPAPESVEGKMLKILEEYGPAMDGEEYAEKCIAAGVNATSFYIYRMISPAVASLGRGIYAKVGTEVPPGIMEEIISKRRSAPRVSDHGWLPNGSLWFGIEISRIVIIGGSIRLAPFVSELVQGDWTVHLPDGSECGAVFCTDTFIRPFRKVFSVLGVEPDDFVAFEFDIKSRIVTVRAGGPELFEAIQDIQSYDTAAAELDA